MGSRLGLQGPAGLFLQVILVDLADKAWLQLVLWVLSGPNPVLLPYSVQFPGHVALGVGDGRGAVPPGPAHPGHPGLQPPL